MGLRECFAFAIDDDGFKMCNPPDYNTICVILLITPLVETVFKCVILLITQFAEPIPSLQGPSHMEFTKLAVTPSKGFQSG